jgi:8-oxo-dGTP pyrophosphatase MutT (NUDIX family)
MRKYRSAAIVIRNNKILVIKRDKHGEKYYCLPGGGIEDGENPRQTVAREILEETSLKIKVGSEVYEHRYETGQRHYYFLCEYISGKVKFVGDAMEIAANLAGDTHKPMWFPLAKLPETLLYPLEIRDWLIEDLEGGFPKKPRIAELQISDLRQSL